MTTTLLPDLGIETPIVIGNIQLLDSDNDYFFTDSDTTIILTIGYAVNTDDIETITFKYRINSGSWQTYTYSDYTTSHTWTNISLTEGDIIEGRVTVKYIDDGDYYDFPRVPVISLVVEKESISIIKRMRRDFSIIMTQHGFYIHRIPLIRELMTCECIDVAFGRPRAYCKKCDGLGIVGGYDTADKIKVVLQGKVPYALHGDARIFTRIGEFDRADAVVFIGHDTTLNTGDKIFYNSFRWKVLNDIEIPVAGAKIYSWHAISKEIGLRDEQT